MLHQRLVIQMYFRFQEQQDLFTVLGGVLNMGNIAFEMDENEGAIIKEAHGPLRTAAVSGMLYLVTNFGFQS